MVLVCGTSTCHMAISQNKLFIPGVWGPYWSGMEIYRSFSVWVLYQFYHVIATFFNTQNLLSLWGEFFSCCVIVNGTLTLITLFIFNIFSYGTRTLAHRRWPECYWCIIGLHSRKPCRFSSPCKSCCFSTWDPLLDFFMLIAALR